MTLHLLDPEAAIAAARQQSKHGPEFAKAGMCAFEVRKLYSAPSSGDADHDDDADAVDVYLRAAPTDRRRISLADLEHGVELWRGAPLVLAGGSAGHGHIVVPTGRGRGLGSLVWSPDTKRARWFDRVTVGDVLAWVNHGSTLGQVRTLGGVRIDLPRDWHATTGGPR